MTILGLVIYAVEAFLFSLFLYWLPRLMDSMRLSRMGTDKFYVVMFFCEDFFFAGVIILLVAAAFSGRGAQQTETPHPPSNFEE